MTLEQEQHLQQLLKEWRDERHLTVESQREGLIGNLCEEFAEYERAIDDNEKIDTLCDIYVFCLNSIDEKSSLKNIREYNGIDSPANDDIRNLKIDLYRYRFYQLYKLSEALKTDVFVETQNRLYVFLIVCEITAAKLGYNFYECMLETIKEISSRTGHYDESIHKFVKDTSDEAKSKWYKANYESCKI